MMARGLYLLVLSTLMACESEARIPSPEEEDRQEEVLRTVDQIQRVECLKTDAVLVNEGLNDENIITVRTFCAMSTEEMIAEISARFLDTGDSESSIGEISQPVYTCNYNGTNFDIPNYSHLGLSSAMCTWHDPNPGCKIEGLVACLWGCNNNDPVLGWHTKWYASRAAVEADLLPKGYASVQDYAGGDYRRSLPYGYSYQVHAQNVDANGQGTWHCEGPEPDSRFSWHAYFGGWWPIEARSWHASC